MINALNLLWIIPLSVTFGFSLCSVLTMSSDCDELHEETTE